MKTQVIELKQGDTCKIDCGTHGTNIVGPAYIVVLQDEAAVGATTSDEQFTWGKSKWDDGSVFARDEDYWRENEGKRAVKDSLNS